MAHLKPGEATLKEYSDRQAALAETAKALKSEAGLVAETRDGRRLNLFANIGRPEEVDQALANGAEGIGLFRTEFLFMDRPAMPSEEEQFSAYRDTVERMGGKPVIIRNP